MPRRFSALRDKGGKNNAKTLSPVTVEGEVRHDADHATEVGLYGKLTGDLSTDELDTVAAGLRISNIRANVSGVVHVAL
jgi:hypothetical protein